MKNKKSKSIEEFEVTWIILGVILTIMILIPIGILVFGDFSTFGGHLRERILELRGSNRYALADYLVGKKYVGIEEQPYWHSWETSQENWFEIKKFLSQNLQSVKTTKECFKGENLCQYKEKFCFQKRCLVFFEYKYENK